MKTVAEMTLAEHEAYLEGARWAFEQVNVMPEAGEHLLERTRGLERGMQQVLDLSAKLREPSEIT